MNPSDWKLVIYISVNCRKGVNSSARSIKIFYPSHETGDLENPFQIDRGRSLKQKSSNVTIIQGAFTYNVSFLGK